MVVCSIVFVLLQSMTPLPYIFRLAMGSSSNWLFRDLNMWPSIYLFVYLNDWLIFFTWCFCGLNPWHWRTDLSRIIAGECLNLAETWWAKYGNVKETRRSASFIFHLCGIQASMLLQVNYLDSLNIYIFRQPLV